MKRISEIAKRIWCGRATASMSSRMPRSSKRFEGGSGELEAEMAVVSRASELFDEKHVMRPRDFVGAATLPTPCTTSAAPPAHPGSRQLADAVAPEARSPVVDRSRPPAVVGAM